MCPPAKAGSGRQLLVSLVQWGVLSCRFTLYKGQPVILLLGLVLLSSLSTGTVAGGCSNLGVLCPLPFVS
jgi:hypothetical protein